MTDRPADADTYIRINMYSYHLPETVRSVFPDVALNRAAKYRDVAMSLMEGGGLSPRLPSAVPTTPRLSTRGSSLRATGTRGTSRRNRVAAEGSGPLVSVCMCVCVHDAGMCGGGLSRGGDGGGGV